MYTKNQLMFQWLSPSFPTGSFNFSQGLEYAVSQSMVKNEADLVVWIENNLEHGFLRNDAIFLKLAYQISKDKDLDDLNVAIITPDKDIIPDAENLKPAYVVFDNYEIILQWNRSLRFSLAVCTLKDKFRDEL